MRRIESFSVDHTRLLPGLYRSRCDKKDGIAVTTFDLRFTVPNREPVLGTAAVHAFEHLGATFLRNSERGEDVVYFGPMGCRTGFYLLMFGDLMPGDVLPIVEEMCRFVSDYEGNIPGATPAECGNYSDMDLEGAKRCARRYLEELKERRLRYPEE